MNPTPTEEISDDEVTEVRERTPIKEDCKVLLNFAAQALGADDEATALRHLRLMRAYLVAMRIGG